MYMENHHTLPLFEHLCVFISDEGEFRTSNGHFPVFFDCCKGSYVLKHYLTFCLYLIILINSMKSSKLINIIIQLLSDLGLKY